MQVSGLLMLEFEVDLSSSFLSLFGYFPFWIPGFDMWLWVKTNGTVLGFSVHHPC